MSSFIRAKIPQAARFFHSSQGLLSPSGWSWKSQMRKAGGTAVMYFPVVTAAFFWPYAVAPVMNIGRRVKNMKPENRQQ